MSKFFSALLEAILLAAIASGIGLYANSRMGPNGGFDPNEARYHRRQVDMAGDSGTAEKGTPAVKLTADGAKPEEGSKTDSNPETASKAPALTGQESSSIQEANHKTSESGGAAEKDSATPYQTSSKHEFRVVTAETVLAILRDPLTDSGLNVFVDARDAKHFDKGHIPGAIPCDPMQPELFMDAVVERASQADRVVVYCNGGECEDSIAVCRQLLANGLNKENIYLYEGGWEEWSKLGYPSE